MSILIEKRRVERGMCEREGEREGRKRERGWGERERARNGGMEEGEMGGGHIFYNKYKPLVERVGTPGRRLAHPVAC